MITPEPSLRALIIGQTSILCPTGGAQIRNYYLARALGRHMAVEYVGFDDIKPIAGLSTPIVQDAAMPESVKITVVPHPAGYTFTKLVRGFVGSTSVTILNYTSDAMNQALRAAFSRGHFDIVQIEGVHLMSSLPLIFAARTKPPRVVSCDWHNIESELMERYSEQCSGLRSIYARRTAGQIARAEDHILRSCNVHVVVSERDRGLLKERHREGRFEVIENGVDISYFSPENLQRCAGEMSEVPSGPNLVFVGAMDYHANVDGVTFFANEVWPMIRASVPDATFFIVGRNPSSAVTALSAINGIKVTGAVPDVRAYYANASVAVVPLRLGAGTRLKILEAMASGVPVVATTIGAEGLNAQTGKQLLIADDPKTLAESIISLVGNQSRRGDLASVARSFVKERYDWEQVGESLVRCYKAALQNSDSGRREGVATRA